MELHRGMGRLTGVKLLTSAVLGALLLAACGGSGAPNTATPSATHSPSPTAIPSPTVTLIPGVAHFRGVIVTTDDGCAYDATCSVTVRVTDVLDGEAVKADDQVTIVESPGFSVYPCLGQWNLGRSAGQTAEILAGPDDLGPLSLCGSADFYEHVLSAPTPTS